MFHSFDDLTIWDSDQRGVFWQTLAAGVNPEGFLLILNIKVINFRLLLHHLGPGASTGCPERTGTEIQLQIKGGGSGKGPVYAINMSATAEPKQEVTLFSLRRKETPGQEESGGLGDKARAIGGDNGGNAVLTCCCAA